MKKTQKLDASHVRWADRSSQKAAGGELLDVGGFGHIDAGLVWQQESDDLDSWDMGSDHTASFDISQLASDLEIPDLPIDHMWLDPHQQQDPDRLPHLSNVREEIAGQWLANQPKFLLRDAKDLGEIRQDRPVKDKSASRGVLSLMVQHGLQLAHKGDTLDAIKTKIGAHVQGAALDSVLRKVAPHVGLAGRFYILASAFPGIESGRWNPTLAKMNSARFLVASGDHPISQLPHFLGRDIVSSVPLDKIWEHHLPSLQLSDSDARADLSRQEKLVVLRRAAVQERDKGERGVEMRVRYKARYDPSSPLTAREEDRGFSSDLILAGKVQAYLEDLKKAGFLDAEEVSGFMGLSMEHTVIATRKYILKHKKAKIPAFKKSALYKGPREKQVYRATLVGDTEGAMALEGRAASKDTNARDRIAHLLSIYGYSEEESRRFQSGKPQRQLAALLQDIQRGHKIPVPRAKAASGYSGQKLTLHGSFEVGPDYEAMQMQAKAIASRGAEGAQEALQTWLDRGWLSRDEHQDLSTMPPHRALYAAQLLIFNTRRNAGVPRALPSKTYSLPQFRAQENVSSFSQLSDDDQLLHKQATKHGVSVKNILAAVRWVKEHMNRGWAGPWLETGYEEQFSSNLRRAAAPYVEPLRKQLEGLAGHLLTDPSAYFSGSTGGCDVGAQRNRANNVKLLLAMDACGSCVFQNSEGRCTKYAKTLVTSEELKAPEVLKIQEKNLKLANMTDAEKTADLFVNEWDGDQYDIMTPDLDVEAYPLPERDDNSSDDDFLALSGFLHY